MAVEPSSCLSRCFPPWLARRRRTGIRLWLGTRQQPPGSPPVTPAAGRRRAMQEEAGRLLEQSWLRVVQTPGFMAVAAHAC